MTMNKYGFGVIGSLPNSLGKGCCQVQNKPAASPQQDLADLETWGTDEDARWKLLLVVRASPEPASSFRLGFFGRRRGWFFFFRSRLFVFRLFRLRSNCFRFGQCGLDSLMLDQ